MRRELKVFNSLDEQYKFQLRTGFMMTSTERLIAFFKMIEELKILDGKKNEELRKLSVGKAEWI